MKKLLALTVALCLFCISFAFAENVASDGSPLQLDDFTLTLNAGMVYQLSEKITNQVYLTVFPYAASGDGFTNFNFVPTGERGPVTADMVNNSAEQTKQQIIDGLTAQGVTLNSLEYGEAVDYVLGNTPCVYCDIVMDIALQSYPLKTCQRTLYFGEEGYVVTISVPANAEAIDPLMEQIGRILSWN